MMLCPVVPPRVSIVCIFYDAERFLAEAIESVLAQGFVDWELLLVDDGSRDASIAIARHFAAHAHGRVRYLDQSGHTNRGMSASRNRGLAEARGEFVAFIDADDVWRPAKLARQVALLESNPAAGMVCGTVNYWRSWSWGKDRLVTTGLAGAVLRPPQTSLALYPLGHAHAPCPSDVMVRRSLIDAVGRFEFDAQMLTCNSGAWAIACAISALLTRIFLAGIRPLVNGPIRHSSLANIVESEAIL